MRLPRKLRVLVLVDSDLVPPDSLDGVSDEQMMEWKTEYDVCTTLREMDHEVLPLGISTDLAPVHEAVEEFQPHVAFNLMEEFHGVAVYEHHIAAFLELLKQPYTGCNPRGLMLCHDKALSKQLLDYHGVPTPAYFVASRGRTPRRPQTLEFPLLVKSVNEDASYGITTDSIVHDDHQLKDRIQQVFDEVGSDALVEQYIEGRELYVGVLGNRRLTALPPWELAFKRLPSSTPNIATAQVKWDLGYQNEVGVHTQRARKLPAGAETAIEHMCKRIYRLLGISGYARMDIRLDDHGVPYVLEANPNPNLSYGEDFAEAAHAIGIDYAELIQRVLKLGIGYEPEWRRA